MCHLVRITLALSLTQSFPYARPSPLGCTGNHKIQPLILLSKEIRKLRFSEVRYVAEAHTQLKVTQQGLEPTLDPKATFLTTLLTG